MHTSTSYKQDRPVKSLQTKDTVKHHNTNAPIHYRINPTFHVSLLKPFVPGLPEMEIEGLSVYMVKEILWSRRRGDRLECLGDRHEEQCWVAAKDIPDLSLLQEFHRPHPQQPAPHPRGCTCQSAPRGGFSGATTITQEQRTTLPRSVSPDI